MGHTNLEMNKKQKQILWVGSGVVITGALGLLIYKKLKKKTSGVSLLTTNSNVLPRGFRNWKGGGDYLLNYPRGIRNNNPGNLVKTSIAWKGKVPVSNNKDRRFEMFIAPEYGVRAMIKDLKNDIAKGKNTIATLISEYAPRFENDTQRYITHVSKALKVSSTAKLLPTKNTLRLLVISIAQMENGGSYVDNTLFEKAYRLV